MVYYVPTIHACPKCNAQVEHSQSVRGSIITDEKGKPFCMQCLQDFLHSSGIPVMTNTGVRADHP